MKKRINKRNRFLLIALAAVLLVAVGGQYLRTRHNKAVTPTSVGLVSPSDAAANTVNLNPPTEQEKADAEQNKDQVVKRNELESTPPTTQTKAVTPTITSVETGSDVVTIRASISGVVEDGGTCTVTATKGGEKTSGTSTGLANASNTVCTTRISRSSFSSSGSWNFALNYTSSTAKGDSATKTQTVN